LAWEDSRVKGAVLSDSINSSPEASDRDADDPAIASVHPKALVIEDDRPTRMLLERILRSRGHLVTSCGSAEEALALLETAYYPLITLDIRLPGMSGLEFAKTLRAKEDGDSYFILAGTGDNRTEDLREILAAGVDDYISKPYHPGLLDIRLSVAEAALVGLARRKALEAELVYLALHDPLTGLMNRSGLNAVLEGALDRARAGGHGTLLYLDLDNFKIVNDSLGHEAGDGLLKRVATILREVSSVEDSLVRFGGDEFVLVMPGCALHDARERAEALREALEELVYVAGQRTLRVGASIGLAAIDGRHSASEVMGYADEACYAAKARGRNCVEIHTPETGAIARLIADIDWSSRIRDAMRDGSLQLWFQPVVSVVDGSCFAQELLLRYGEGDNSVAPPVFLEAMRRSAQMQRLDRFVIARAFESLASHPHLTVSINISGQLFADPEYVSFIEHMIGDSGIQPRRILFEITEDDLIANLQSASGAIRRLQEIGCRFGLDDFGSGFSSLSYLKSLPIDFIKIDGSFIRDIQHEPFHLALIKGVKGIADVLGIRTVAEFVETREQLEIIREVGIDFAQGHLFAKPRKEPFLPAEFT